MCLFGWRLLAFHCSQNFERCSSLLYYHTRSHQGYFTRLGAKGSTIAVLNLQLLRDICCTEAFCILLINQLKWAVDILLLEEQAWFRSGRSCTKQIFTLRNIIEQCMEYQTCLEINFIDFKNAFDSVHHPSLWKIAHLHGIPDCFINLCRALYDNTQCCVKMVTWTTSFLKSPQVCNRVEFCTPSFSSWSLTLWWRSQQETKDMALILSGRCISDLDFVDGIALMANDCVTLQKMTSLLEENVSKVGLRISTEKTKVMTVGIQGQQTVINIGQNCVEDVNCITYIGSTISNNRD